MAIPSHYSTTQALSWRATLATFDYRPYGMAKTEQSTLHWKKMDWS
jgi:hypothetical protein